MGYHLNSLYSISPDDRHAYFVFMLGGSYGLVNSTQEWLDRNFNAVAKALGPKAAIVRGLSPSFDTEVVNAYQESIRTKVVDFRVDEYAVDQIVSGLASRYRVRIEAPILLVTDRNPHKIDDQPSVFYFLPVGGLTEGETQKVVQTILSCIRTNDFEPLDKWVLMTFGNAPLNALQTLNQVVELKPGIAGLSINLNAIIERILQKDAAR